MEKTNIIVIQDLLDTKARKEKELIFYQEELKKLQEKMHYIQLEIQLTSDIIVMIENERMMDLRKLKE
jgi:cell fate regulator YaaT (PSP1 superfamily)